MGLLHLLVDFTAHWAFGLDVPRCWLVLNDQGNRIFLRLQPIGKPIHHHDFLHLLAVWVLAFFHMFVHALNDPPPFLFDELQVLIVFVFGLPPFHLVPDFLKGVGVEDLELLLDLLLLVAIPFFDLVQLVGLSIWKHYIIYSITSPANPLAGSTDSPPSLLSEWSPSAPSGSTPAHIPPSQHGFVHPP